MLLQTLLEEPIIFFLWVGAVIFALTIHEFSHALAGKLQGDPTAEMAGRLTLNPLSHIDWMGFFLLVVAGFGWAKPTPFNPYNLKYKKWGPALVAFAGPISNMLAAVILTVVVIILQATVNIEPTNLMLVFISHLIFINILLAAFNLIPIPPLDGSKVLFTFIHQKRPDIVMFLERYGIWMLLILIFLGGSVMSRFFMYVLTGFFILVEFVSPAAAALIIAGLPI